MWKREVGARLREIRIGLGHKQAQFGEKCGGYKAASISEYESGTTTPPIPLLIAAARLGRRSVAWVLTGAEEQANRKTVDGVNEASSPTYGAAAIDTQLLANVIRGIEGGFELAGVKVSANDRAQLIANGYEMALAEREVSGKGNQTNTG